RPRRSGRRARPSWRSSARRRKPPSAPPAKRPTPRPLRSRPPRSRPPRSRPLRSRPPRSRPRRPKLPRWRPKPLRSPWKSRLSRNRRLPRNRPRRRKRLSPRPSCPRPLPRRPPRRPRPRTPATQTNPRRRNPPRTDAGSRHRSAPRVASAMPGIAPDTLLLMGRCGRAHGVRGEVKVFPETDDPDRFAALARVFVGPSAEEAEERAVERVRFQPQKGRTVVLLHLGGVPARDEAEALRGLGVYAHEDDLPPLDEDEVYLHDLVGLD